MKPYQLQIKIPIKIYKCFNKERKKQSYSSQWEKNNREKMEFVLEQTAL